MRLPVEERYHRDATFRQLVDWMMYHIRTADYTPTELREAAILAATMHEMYNIRASRYVFVDPGNGGPIERQKI